MASSTRAEPPSSFLSSLAANAPPLVSMEANMIVATGGDQCHLLKDIVSKQDPSTMVVVMASSHQTSTPPKPPSRSPPMDPSLLAVASSGSWKKLQAFLNGDPRPTSGEIVKCCCCSWMKRPVKPHPTSSGDGIYRRCCRFLFPPESPHPTSGDDGAIGSSAIQPPSIDLEAHPRDTILDGVTFEGDTFLHVMATNCFGEDLFQDELGPIRGKAVEYLFKRNNNDDTALHCAARANKLLMGRFLLELARGKDDDTVKALLETTNKRRWTVLHEAVRVGNNHMVSFFMNNDPDLASFPTDGTSPMYLAISLQRKTIAQTLHRKSSGLLSYSGPNGQNALHAAVLRKKGTTSISLFTLLFSMCRFWQRFAILY
ncbi:unnamed protein product [Alopecurus aequalis]